MKMIKSIFPAICLVAALLFLLALYGPVEVYLTNIEDFSYDVWDVIINMLPVFLLGTFIAVLAFLLIYRINTKLYSVFLTIGFAALAAIYVQGNFFSGNLPPLDGTVINWAEYDGQRFASIIIWVLALAISFLLMIILKAEKFGKFIGGVCLFAIVMLAVTAVLIGITEDGFRAKEQVYVSDKGLLEIGDEENFIILLLDCVGGEEAQTAIEENKELKEAFKDFTLFPDTVGCYPYTQYSIPFLFSGEWYENNEQFGEYNERAFRESGFLKQLESRSFRIGIYDDSVPSSYESAGRFMNTCVINSRVFKYPVEYIKTQLKLTFFKYLPYDVKRFCVMVPDFLYANSQKKTDNMDSLFFWGDSDFYSRVVSDGITELSGKKFSFIHLEGAHNPFRYDADMNYKEDASYEDAVGACLKIAATFVEKIRQSDVYPNTTIIIMADHSYVPTGEYPTVREGRQNPILMIKGKHESHDYIVSGAPISYVDLMEAYSRLLDGEKAEDAFDAKKGDIRDRRFLNYVFLYEDCLEEYIQSGYATDSLTFQPTGKVFERTGLHLARHLVS